VSDQKKLNKNLLARFGIRDIAVDLVRQGRR